jgi:transposase
MTQPPSREPQPRPPAFLLEQTPRQISSPPRRGDVCPNCGNGKLDYNGVLDLECPLCRYALSGGGGCT